MTNVALPNLSAVQQAQIRDALTTTGAPATYPTSGAGWHDRVDGLMKRVASNAPSDQDRMQIAEAHYALEVMTGTLTRKLFAVAPGTAPSSPAMAGVQALLQDTQLLRIQLQSLTVQVALGEAAESLEKAMRGLESATASAPGPVDVEKLTAANAQATRSLAEMLELQTQARISRSAAEERMAASRDALQRMVRSIR